MPKLTWIGKHKVINHERDVPFRVLNHQDGFQKGKQSHIPTIFLKTMNSFNCLSLISKAIFCFLILLLPAFSAHSQPTTWQTRGVGGGGALFSPSINPANVNEIYVGCDMTELFHTTNQGASWVEKPFQQIQGGMHSEVQFTRDPNIRYCVNHAAKDNVDRLRPFKTDDGGATWYQLIAPIPSNASIVRMYADYDSPSRLVLVVYNEIFFSTNGGGDFTRIYQTANSTIGNHIAGVCFDGNNIYICCEDGIYYSTDSGTSWAWLATTGLAGDEKILSFTWAKTGGALKFVCLTAHRVWSDIRRGSTYWQNMRGIFTMLNVDGQWTRRVTGIHAATTDYVAWLGMAQTDTSVVYAAGGDNYLKPIVMKSVNSQAWQHTFFHTNNQNILTGWSGERGDGNWDYGSAPQGFQVCPTNPNMVITSDMGFTHLTTNGGTSWQQLYLNATDQNPVGSITPKKKPYHSNGLENTSSWSVTWLDEQKIMASYTDIGGITSLDAGATWKFSPILENSTYRILKHSDGKIYAATSSIHDLYQSNRIYDESIDAGGGKIYFSTDNGLTFSVLKDFAHPVVWLQTDPTDPSVLYASVLHSDVTIGGIYKTLNLQNGTAATWTKMPLPSRANGHPFNIHVLNNGDLVATFSARVPTPADQFTDNSGVFYFNKTSQTWSDRSHSNMRFWTKDVTIDPTDATQSTWYVAVFQGWGNVAMQGTGGLYRTRDKGLTWAKISSEFRVNAATIHPQNADMLYYSTETNGLWFSTNATAATPTFSRVESYPFRHPMRVFFNPYKLNEIWVTSFGNGIKIGTDPSIVLPVELLSFQGFSEKQGNRLTWTFGETKDLANIEVQKSPEGQNFTPLSILSKNDRFFTDTVPFNLTYYRLKIKDLEGKFQYSKIISLVKTTKVSDTEGVSYKDFTLFPNPTTNDFTLQFHQEPASFLECRDIFGRLVFTEKLDNNISQFDFSAKTLGLSAGVYFLKTDKMGTLAQRLVIGR